jgi:CRP-like cAMP-binding protein
MFVVLSGEVSLDVGTPSPLAHSYGPGALIGLPAALSHQNYSMTATVTEDAELSVWTPEELNGLLAARPDICQQLLALMAERIAENREILKAILSGDIRPPQNSTVV